MLSTTMTNLSMVWRMQYDFIPPYVREFSLWLSFCVFFKLCSSLIYVHHHRSWSCCLHPHGRLVHLLDHFAVAFGLSWRTQYFLKGPKGHSEERESTATTQTYVGPTVTDFEE